MDNHILNLAHKIKFKIVKDIEEEKNDLLDHGLIGISPSNSYYSEENITELVKWSFSTFKDFNFFIPDKWSIYTIMAQGYTEQKARMKTKKGDFRLKNKIIRAFKNNNISEEIALEKILLATTLVENKYYQKIHRKCVEKFNDNKFFRDMCLATSRDILSKYSNVNNDESTHIAVKYFLHELPLFLDTPKILTVPSSFCVYHNIPSFIEHIYKDDSLNSRSQGFMVATTTE